jgi:cytochrome b561
MDLTLSMHKMATIQFRNTVDRYGAVAKSLHWIIVVLIVIQVVLGFVAHGMPIGQGQLLFLTCHKSIGITIFGLAVIRLGWRLYSPAPPLPATLSAIDKIAAHASHVILYALLFALPLVGWVESSASGLTVSWFGLIGIPDLLGPNAHLALLAKTVHMSMAWLLILVAGAHLIAALAHHFVFRNEVLVRMLPLARHIGALDTDSENPIEPRNATINQSDQAA